MPLLGLKIPQAKQVGRMLEVSHKTYLDLMESDKERYYEHLTHLAWSFCPEACFNLGNNFFFGHDCEREQKEGINWWVMANDIMYLREMNVSRLDMSLINVGDITEVVPQINGLFLFPFFSILHNHPLISFHS
jgi:hypothetical protein